MKKKRLLIYFCICLALVTLLGVSFFYLRKLNALEKDSARVDHSYRVIIQTNQLEQRLLNVETSQRGYFLSDNASFLESYLADLRGLPDILADLDSLTVDNRVQQMSLDTLREAINQQLQILKNNLAAYLNDSIHVASFHASSVQMNRISELISHIKNRENSLLSERFTDKTNTTHASKRSSYLSLIIAFAVCCIASVTIIWFFNRNEIYRTELEDKLRKLTLLNAEIRELAIASSHNLQEPMRKVQTIVDRLQHYGLQDASLADQLGRIRDIYSRQQLINNKIIDYYSILLNGGEKSLTDLNLLLTGLQQKNGWSSAFELKVEPLPAVMANHEQMELLFTHLISNALQFRSPLRPLRVHIHQVPGEKEHYCIAVSDNGIGIDETYYTKIFDLFQKLEPTRANSMQSGMGLSFCKRIMLNHNGRIAAQKSGENGLSILLFFPARA